MADSMWLNRMVMNVAFDKNKINRMKTVTDKYYKTFRYTGSFDSKIFFESEPWGHQMPSVLISYDVKDNKVRYSFIPKFVLGKYIVKPDIDFDNGILVGELESSNPTTVFYRFTERFVSDAKLLSGALYGYPADYFNYILNTDKYKIFRDYLDDGTVRFKVFTNCSSEERNLYDSSFRVKTYSDNNITILLTNNLSEVPISDYIVDVLPVAKL